MLQERYLGGCLSRSLAHSSGSIRLGLGPSVWNRTTPAPHHLMNSFAKVTKQSTAAGAQVVGILGGLNFPGPFLVPAQSARTVLASSMDVLTTSLFHGIRQHAAKP